MAIAVVWGENIHERKDPAVTSVYPDGMHATIARHSQRDCPATRSTATLEQPQHGLDAARLVAIDVLLWWGHLAHHKVDDAVVEPSRSACSTAWG